MTETGTGADLASLTLPVTQRQVTRMRQPGMELEICGHMFDSGLRLYDTRIRTTHNLLVEPTPSHDRPFIGAHVSVQGATTLSIPDCTPSTATSAQGSFFRTMGDSSSFRTEHAANHLRVIGIAADLDMVGQWFGGHLPASLRPFLHSKLRTHHAATVPVSAAHSAAAALADTSLHGPMRTLMLEGAAMQMMSAFLQSLCRHEHVRHALHTRERRAAMDAHAMLRENLDITFSIADLGKAVKLTPSRLQKAFRELYGASVFSVQRQLRMDQAMTLLRGTYLPIRMIATQVGYTNRESFRRAFHAHFGINPASVRSSH